MPAFPRDEMEEMMRRWVAANGEAGETGKWSKMSAFYTEDATPLCAAQVTSFKDEFETLAELGAQVVAISADDLDSHRKFAESLGGLGF